jgi:hypothetical protein
MDQKQPLLKTICRFVSKIYNKKNKPNIHEIKTKKSP